MFWRHFCLVFILGASALFAQADYSNPKAIGSKLTKEIKEELIKSTKSGGPSSFLISKPNVTKLLQWTLLANAGPDKIQELGATKVGAGFLTELFKDNDWMNGVLFSGPIPDPALALQYLSHLCKLDPKIYSTPILKKLATATALEFSRNKWDIPSMEARYAFYADSWDENRLNTQFDELDFWDMRIVAGCKNDNWGSVQSLTWARDNMRLPAQVYPGACWHAPYRLFNILGDSIHGADYYKPFSAFFKNSQSHMTRDVGGVCGGLSHYGTFSALGNGVVAMTFGEPGHCAYAVRINKTTWVPGYSMHWKRGCHWQFWQEYSWAFLILTQELYQDTANTLASNQLGALAHFAYQTNDRKSASLAYAAALKKQPINFPVWLDYINFLKRCNIKNPKVWMGVNNLVLTSFAKNLPDVAWTILGKYVYPELMPLLKKDEDKLRLCMSYHHAVDKMLPIRWEYDNCLATQLKFLGEGDAMLMKYLTGLLNYGMTKPDYVSNILAWGQEQASKTKELQDKFIATALKTMGTKRVGDDALISLCTNMLLSAEKNKDLRTFSTVRNILKKQMKGIEPLPSYPKPSGKAELVSAGGMCSFSSVSEHHGEPWRHVGITEPEGGHFHTNDDENAWALVELPRIADVTNITIVATADNQWRLNNMFVESSLDGESWTEIARFGPCQRILQQDLKTPVRARYIRVTRPDKNIMHLNAIHVYGKKAS